VGIAACPARVIDRVNILEATRLAMHRAVARIQPLPDAVLVDGWRLPGLEMDQWPIVDGDRDSISIAAASLVAKVVRDAIMCRLDQLYPGYGFAQHKGYATREHLASITRLGVSPVHRCSFEPVRQALQGKLDLAVEAAIEEE
jgi:ribonuclease HII